MKTLFKLAVVILLIVIVIEITQTRKAQAQLPASFNMGTFIQTFQQTGTDQAEIIKYNGNTYPAKYPKIVMGVKTVWIEELNRYLWWAGDKWLVLL